MDSNHNLHDSPTLSAYHPGTGRTHEQVNQEVRLESGAENLIGSESLLLQTLSPGNAFEFPTSRLTAGQNYNTDHLWHSLLSVGPPKLSNGSGGQRNACSAQGLGSFEKVDQGTEPLLPQADVEGGGANSAAVGSTEFLFTDGLDRSYSRETRRFVLKRHFAKKRKLVRDRLKGNKQPDLIPSKAVGPLYHLGQSPVDPFDSLPLMLKTKELYLVRHFINMSVAAHSHKVRKFDPYRCTWHYWASQNKMILSGILAMAANHLSTFDTAISQTEILQYQTSTITLLNQQLSNLQDDYAYESAMIAIVLLDWIWKQSKTTDTAEAPYIYRSKHTEGLRQILVRHGGLFPARTRSGICNITILGADVETWGQISSGLSPVSTHALSALSITQNLNFGGQIDAIPVGVQELLGFYANTYFHALFRRQEARTTSSSSGDGTLIRLRSIWHNVARYCQSEGVLHRLLTMSRRPHTLAAIIYLNIVLWDLRDGPIDVLESYFDRIHREVVDEGLNHTGFVDTLLVLLHSAGEERQLECPDRAWLMTRLLNVTQKLSGDLQKRLETDLLSFLAMADTAQSQPGCYSWQPESFARDVLHDLKLLNP